MTKEERQEKELEKVKKYHAEGRGEWWFYPWYKKILYIIIAPFIMLWFGICWCIMKLGRGIFVFGDWLSGWRWNEGNWLEDV